MANRAALIRAENAGLPLLRRGRRSLEFDLGNGRRRLVTTIDPLHVSGTETEIDASWQADTGAWQWKMAQGDYQAHARSVFNVGNLVEWRIGNEWIIFDPQSINWINQDNSRQQIAIKQAITGQINDATLSFPAGYGAGRHFEYTAHPNRLIKHITIDTLASLPTPTVTGTIWFEAEWSISTSTGVDFYLDGVKWPKANNVRVRTGNRIEFRDAATGTQVLWLADAPIATDANGETVQAQYEVRRQGGPSALFITVRVPRAWILTAAFPIVIDPTLTLQPDATAGKDTRLNIGLPSNNFGTNNMLLAAGTKGLIEFDCSSIPSDATCDDATFYGYQVNTGTALAFTITIYSIAVGNAAWPEGTKNNAAGVAGDSCWNYLDQATGTETAWAGSAGLATSGTDYEASSIGSFSGNRSDPDGTEYSTLLTAARVAGWFGVSNTNYGMLLTYSAGLGNLGSSDHTTAGYRPKLVVNYTEAGGQPMNARGVRVPGMRQWQPGRGPGF